MSPCPALSPPCRQGGAAAGRRGGVHGAGAQREALCGQQGRAGQPGEFGEGVWGGQNLPPSLRGVDGASVWGVRPSPRLSRAPLRAGGLRAPLPCPDPPPRSAGPPHRLLGQPGPDQLQGPGQPPHGLRLEPLQEHPPGPSLTAGRDRVGGIRDAPSPSRCGRWR